MRIKKGITKHARHNKVHKQTKGYRLTKHALVKTAKEAILHAGQYSFNGRKQKKNDIKKLWIIRINAALKDFSINYSTFSKLEKDKKIEINRKVLAHFATEDYAVFKSIVNTVQNKE